MWRSSLTNKLSHAASDVNESMTQETNQDGSTALAPALGWAVAPKYWKVPSETWAALNAEFGPFDFDPCPCPRPEGYDSLIVPWGNCNFVNPPFRKRDGDGKGPTAFVRKAIAEQMLGKTSVIIIPVQSYVNLLLEAGAELRSLGRLKWREATTGEPMANPTPICCFVLRPQTDGVTAQPNEA